MWIERNHLRMNVAPKKLLVFSRRHRKKEVKGFTTQHQETSIEPESGMK